MGFNWQELVGRIVFGVGLVTIINATHHDGPFWAQLAGWFALYTGLDFWKNS